MEFKVSRQGRLSTAARQGASAVMLLQFKKGIIEAARRADNAIINVITNETWAALKILVPYAQYRHPSGLADLWDPIEMENEGVVVPPFSMRWMRCKTLIEQHFQDGNSPWAPPLWSSRCPARPRARSCSPRCVW